MKTPILEQIKYFLGLGCNLEVAEAGYFEPLTNGNNTALVELHEQCGCRSCGDLQAVIVRNGPHFDLRCDDSYHHIEYIKKDDFRELITNQKYRKPGEHYND